MNPSQRSMFGSPLNLRWLALAAGIGLMAGVLPWLAGGSLLLGAALLFGILGLVVLVIGWPFSGVAILIVAALLTRYRFDVGPVSVRPEHIAALAVGGVALIQLLMNRGRVRMPLAAWFAVGWWAMNFISGIFFSPDLGTGLQNSLRLALLALTFVLVLNLIPNRRQWRWAVGLFLVAGVVEAAFGVVARVLFPFGINLGVQVSWNFSEPIPYGTFEEGNLFGSHAAAWAIVLLTLILTADIWRRPPSARQLLRFAGLFILLAALFLSLSRAAWLTFALGVGLAWIFYRRESWHQSNRMLLLLLAAPFFLLMVLSIAPILPAHWPFVDRLQSFLDLSTDATFSARLSDWALAWGDWLKQPFTGWGPGSFFDIHGELRGNPAWISNLSLRLLQETGIIGAFFFFAYVFTLTLPAVKVSRKQSNSSDRAALLGLTLSFLVLILLAYQSTDGIWIAASWVHAGLIAAGSRVLVTDSLPREADVPAHFADSPGHLAPADLAPDSNPGLSMEVR